MPVPNIRTGITIVIGIVLDIWALPVTVPLWKELFHDQIAEVSINARQSEVLTYALIDFLGAVIIIVAIGLLAAGFLVEYVTRMFTNHRF